MPVTAATQGARNTATQIAAEPAALRVLVAIASYGNGNDKYLHRLLEEYRAMPFHVDVVILSNIEKRPAADIECLVGLPNKNPWSLPFSHKRLFAERLEKYDLFIYSEDDILVTENNIRAFLKASAVLRDDEIAGFLLVEKGSNGNVSYPQVHGFFHWDCEFGESEGRLHARAFHKSARGLLPAHAKPARESNSIRRIFG